MVKVVPVNMGVPPVGVVYQLSVAPGVVEDAVMVAVWPALTVWVGGVTVMVGALLALFTVTVPVARVGEVTPAGFVASA